MQSPSFIGDDTAVSPVVGVVLMVGVTVVLAGAVHVYVAGFSERMMHDPSPQAVFTVEAEDCGGEQLSITHRSGHTIPADQLYLQSPDLPLSGSWAHPSEYSTSGTDDGTVQSGDRATVCITDPDDVTIRVVWYSDMGDESVLLVEWNGA